MPETIKKYYKFLIKNFGNVSLAGCHDLAVLINMYDPNKGLKDALTKAAEYTDKTPTAIEKSCRLYLEFALEEYTLEDISKFFDYQFKPNINEKITLAEFLPIVTIYLEQMNEETE